MVKKVKFLLVFCLMFIIEITNVNALGHADTNTYTDISRTTGISVLNSDKVKTNTIIPNEYSFTMEYSYDSVVTSNIKPLTVEEVSQIHFD